MLELAEKSKKTTELVKRVVSELDKLGISHEGITLDGICGDEPINIVFCGQYSAGKSSILRMLTGNNDISIGEGITTQSAHTYEWNGIHVTDTPGIHTKLRPDHDEISYQAIAHADMLVYVITNELFDEHIGANFRKLAIDCDKAGEMILVVNKMMRHELGNCTEAQEIVCNALAKDVAPRTTEELYLSFVDAESYIDSLSEDDEEIREELYDRSGYEQFVQNLNKFIEQKGITSKLTTVLYCLREAIIDGIHSIMPSTGDENIDALIERLMQQKRLLINSRRSLESGIRQIIADSEQRIQTEGMNTANAVSAETDEKHSKELIDISAERVTEIAQECMDDIQVQISQAESDLELEINKLYNTDFSKALDARLKKLDTSKIGGISVETLNKIGSGASNFGGRITDFAFKSGAPQSFKGLSNFSGSMLHETIKKVGSLIGYKFKPWEAVKIAKGIGIAGKVMQGVGVALSIGAQMKEDYDQKEAERRMRECRDSIRSAYNDAAHELKKSAEKGLKEYLTSTYEKAVNEIDMQINDINSQRTMIDENCRKLNGYISETMQLITEIHC